MWNILVHGKAGYRNHPETKRWAGKQKALYLRHQALVQEMARRGYQHHSDLDEQYAVGAAIQTEFIDTTYRQQEILRAKHCSCYTSPPADGPL